MERLTKGYLNKKLRVGKLDSALLYLSSLMGIVFAIIRSLDTSLSTIRASVPLVLFGILFPFYYGYFRGAIHDSPVDRFRGWIFFLAGLGGYSFNIMVGAASQLASLSVGRLSSLVGAPFGILAVVVVFRAGPRFHKKFLRILGRQPSIASARAGEYAATAAIFLASVATSISVFPTIDYLNPTSWIAVVSWLSTVGIAVWFLWRSEKFARMYGKLVETVQIRGRFYGRKRFLDLGVWLIFSAVVVIVVGLGFYSLGHDELFFRYALGGLGLLTLGFVVVLLFGSRTIMRPTT